MSDTFATAPEEGDLTLDPAAKPERSRTFTPGRDQKPDANIPFRRVVSRESGPEEDLEALEAEPAEASPPASWDTADVANLARTRGQLLPALQRNKIYDFLDSMHHRTDPEAIENRLTRLFRFSAVALLCGIVLTVLGSIFLFRARHLAAAVPVAAPARASVAEEAIDAPAAAAEAVATLQAFLESTVAAERQKLIGFDEPLAPCLAVPGRVPALEKSKPSPGDARVVRLGREVAVLVPMIDGAGVGHTAALLKRDGHFRVDWRSVMTPEPMAWKDFVATPVDEPRLFRLELAAAAKATEPGATLSAIRPAGNRRQSR